MKKLFLFLVLVLSGCTANQDVKMVAMASSEAPDREAYYAIDGNADTFWCTEGNENTIPVLTVILPEEKNLKNVIFTAGPNGFDRPDIVEVWYDSQAEALGELHFVDSAGDQSFEMPKDSVTAVKFKFMRSFAGSYGNAQTCISEVKFN